MNKILIIGLGSIGQRHLNALIRIGEKNIAALRTNKGKKEIDAKLNNSIINFTNEKDAFLWKPTHLIISNPTSFHAYYINKAVENGVKFFVEKPIDYSIKSIKNNVTINNDRTFKNGIVGYQLRFHGLFKFLKGIIEDKRYGEVVTAHLHVGQYLPRWHPYEDYRLAYYSRKELGGGVLRTLSHEIDITQYLFGKINKVVGKVETLSKLDIDVDDVTDLLLHTEKCKRVRVHLNYLDPITERKGKVYFDKGLLLYDFINQHVEFFNYKKEEKEIIYESKESYDKQYIEQMKYFLNPGKIGAYPCTMAEGIEVMRVIEASELSTKEKKEICLD